MGKGETTKAAILDTALATASELGLEGLSIGALAKGVGMSKSGLFAHFDSKENLQIEVLETAVELFVEKVVRPALRQPRGLPRIRTMFESWLSWDADGQLPGGCPFVAAAHELDDRPGPVRDHLVRSQRDWIDTVSRAASIAVEEGHFRPDLDLRQFAYEFHSIALSFHHFKRLLRDPDARQRAESAFERLLRDAVPPHAPVSAPAPNDP